MLQPDPLEDLKRAAPLLRGGHAEHLEDEGDVLEYRPRGDEFEVLEDEADAAAIFLDVAARQRGEVVAVDEDLALARLLLTEEQTEQRRLAGAARAGEENEFAFDDGER